MVVNFSIPKSWEKRQADHRSYTVNILRSDHNFKTTDHYDSEKPIFFAN